MEKLSLDTDSPIRGDYKRDVETHTPVRQAQRGSQVAGFSAFVSSWEHTGRIQDSGI